MAAPTNNSLELLTDPHSVGAQSTQSAGNPSGDAPHNPTPNPQNGASGGMQGAMPAPAPVVGAVPPNPSPDASEPPAVGSVGSPMPKGLEDNFSQWGQYQTRRQRGGLFGSIGYFDAVGAMDVQNRLRQYLGTEQGQKDLTFQVRDEQGNAHTRHTFSPEGRLNRGFTWKDEVLGEVHAGQGSMIQDVTGQFGQMQAAKWAAAGHVLSGAVQSALHPSYTPGADMAMSAGRYATMYGVATSDKNMVGGGILSEISGMTYGKTVGLVADMGGQYMHMERPLERLAHIGAGSGGLGGDARKSLDAYGRYGYSAMERAHVSAEFTGAMGRSLTTQELTSVGDLPFEADLKGQSRGTQAFYMRNAGIGGGTSSSVTGAATSLKRDVYRAESMGLRGAGVDEYIQRIAATVEGIGQRGLKIDSGDIGKMSGAFATNALAAAGGDVQNAHGYGARSAALAANFTQFMGDTTHMLDMPGLKNYGQGLMLSEAAQAAEKAGRPGRLGTQLEMEKMLRTPSKFLHTLDKAAGDNEELYTGTLQQLTKMSATEAEAQFRGRKALKAVGMDSVFDTVRAVTGVDVTGSSLDNVKAGAGQDLMRSEAEQTTLLIKALSDLTEQIKASRMTETNMRRMLVGAGGFLAPTTPPAADKGGAFAAHKTDM